MEKKIKINSAVPKESDFIDVILSLKDQTRTMNTYDDDGDYESLLMDSCSRKVSSAETRFANMLFKVCDEFPNVSRLDPLYRVTLLRRFNFMQYEDALAKVSHATMMINDVSENYFSLINADDCDSLDKFKSLKRAAFASMLAVVRSCLPSLAFLDKVREYMANLDDDGVEHVAHDEGFPVPQFTTHEFALDEDIVDLVDPQTLLWLEELDRVPVRCLKDSGLTLVRCATSHTAK